MRKVFNIAFMRERMIFKRGEFSRGMILTLILAIAVLLFFIIYLTTQGKTALAMLFERMGGMFT